MHVLNLMLLLSRWVVLMLCNLMMLMLVVELMVMQKRCSIDAVIINWIV